MEADGYRRRREAFADLMEADGCLPTDYDEGEEEDPRPYLSGDVPCGRFVCVTKNWSSHGEEKLFYLPIFDDLQEATNRAEEYCDDDIFEELPVKIVDLDSSRVYFPEAIYVWNIKHHRILGS